MMMRPKFSNICNAIIAILFVVCITYLVLLLWPSNNKQLATNELQSETDYLLIEKFEQTAPQSQALAQLAQYGISSLAEAKAIIDGTWNETWTSVPKASKTILYYTVFSKSSRNMLLSSPYIWTNISPVFEQKLPENCKVDDSKIVYTASPFTDPTILGIYTKGIQLNNNRGNGPLAMNMGLNVTANDGISANPQKFSIALLLRFNNLAGYVGQTVLESLELLKMRANTTNNNGITLRVSITNQTMPENYRANVKLLFGNANEALLVEGDGIDIKATPSSYYAFVLSRNGSLVSMHMYNIDSSSVETSALVANSSINYSDVIDFSNMPMQLNAGGNFNAINLMAMAVSQEAYTTQDMVDLAAYWKGCLIKTGSVAYVLSQQTLTLSACPFPDSNLCNACTSITDWRDTTQLVTSSETCRAAYNSYCMADTTALGCECYTSEQSSNQQCSAWIDLINGTSSCSQTEIDEYIKNNQVCSTELPATIMQNPLGKVRNFITAEDYDIKGKTTRNAKMPTFWEWLFKI